MMKKKLIIILLASVLVIAIVVAAILILPAGMDKVNLNLSSGTPALAYECLDKIVDDSAVYDLYISQLGSSQQKVDSDINFFYTGVNGQFLAYAEKDEDILDYYVYVMGVQGDRTLVTKDGSYFEIANNQNTICYASEKEPDSLFVAEFDSRARITDEKKLTVEDSVFQEYNFDAGVGLFMKNLRSGQTGAFDDDSVNPYDYNWGDIYLCTAGGTPLKIAEKAFCSNTKQSISDDGSVVFIADCNEKTETGDLYLKTLNGESKLLKENVSNRFAISPNGQLVAAVIKESNNRTKMFYQFHGKEAREIDNVIDFEISQDSSTLVYLVNTDNANRKALYSIKGDSQPVLLTDNAICIQEVSEDGRSVAYLANYSEESLTGDLYVVRAEEEPLFIDSGIYLSSVTVNFGATTVNLRNDGQYIAYLKDIHEDRLYGDLYVAKVGEKAKLIEKNVSTGFDFFGQS
jgi:hypothetical protein